MLRRRIGRLVIVFLVWMFIGLNVNHSIAASNPAVVGVFTAGEFENGHFTNVPLSSGNICIKFSEPVCFDANSNESAVTLTNVKISSDGTCQRMGDTLPVPWDLSADKKTLIINLAGLSKLSELIEPFLEKPYSYFKGGESYSLRVSSSFKNASGQGLSLPYTVVLTTRSQVDVVDVTPTGGDDKITITFNDSIVQQQPEGQTTDPGFDLTRNCQKVALILGLSMDPFDHFVLSPIRNLLPPTYRTSVDDDKESIDDEGDEEEKISILGPSGITFSSTEENLKAIREWANSICDKAPADSQLKKELTAALQSFAESTRKFKEDPSAFFKAMDEYYKACVTFHEAMSTEVPSNISSKMDSWAWDMRKLRADLGWSDPEIIELIVNVQNEMSRYERIMTRSVEIATLEDMYNLPDGEEPPESPGGLGSSLLNVGARFGYGWLASLTFPENLALTFILFSNDNNLVQDLDWHLERWSPEEGTWESLMIPGAEAKISGNSVTISGGIEMLPADDYRVVFDRPLSGLDNAPCGGLSSLQFTVSDPTAPTYSTYSTGNTNNHTVVNSGAASSNSMSLPLPSLSENPFMGNYVSNNNIGTSYPGVLLPPGSLTVQPTASSIYRPPYINIVEPWPSTNTLPAGEDIHVDIRGKAGSGATIKSVQFSVNGQLFQTHSGQNTPATDFWLTCDVPTTGMSDKCVLRVVLIDSDDNIAWGEKTVYLDSKPVVNATATLQNKNNRLVVQTQVTGGKGVVNVNVAVKRNNCSVETFQCAQDQGETVSFLIQCGLTKPSDQYKIEISATGNNEKSTGVLYLSKSKTVASTAVPSLAESVKPIMSALPDVLKAGRSCFIDSLSPFVSTSQILNTVFGLTTRTSANETATLLPSWVLAFTQGLTPANSQSSQPAVNSGPKLSITIKKADGTALSKNGFKAFHGEKITIDFSATDPDKVKQVKVNAICQITIPTAGQTLTFGGGSDVLYEWKASTTNEQKGTVCGSCSWKTTTGTAASNYILEFTAVDGSGKTAIVTCPVSRLADDGKPYVNVQNWDDECCFPANVSLPILVEGNDPPGGSGIAVLGIEVHPILSLSLSLSPNGDPVNWRPTRCSARAAHEFSWDCSKAPGDYRLTASAADASGQITSKGMTIHRPMDNSSPSISITCPSEVPDGATAQITVNTGDDVLVQKVSLSCRRGGVFPSNDWVVLQEWERLFPAYRSGAQGDIWNRTYNWTCTNPFAVNTPYELCAAVWDASGKKTVSQTVSVTRVHDYDVPEVTISINPSTVNEKENTKVAVTATIKESSLQAVYLFVNGVMCMDRPVLLKEGVTGAGVPVYTYRWMFDTMTWKSGKYIVEVQATDYSFPKNKVGVASGEIIVKGQIKQQPETSKSFDELMIGYMTWKYSGSQGNSSSSSNGSGTSGGGGSGGGSSSTGAPNGYYYYTYTPGGDASNPTSGGGTQQSGSPADDTPSPYGSFYFAITGPNGGSGKCVEWGPGKRIESTWVYTGDPSVFADTGSSDNNNNTTVTANPSFGPAVILTPNLDGWYCSNCGGASQTQPPWWSFRKKDDQNTNFTPMLYSHSYPVFYSTVPGSINGGSGDVAIQSAETIKRASQTEISGKIVSKQVLATYNSTGDILSDEAKELRKLTVNENKSIITNISNKGTYSYSTKGGAITKAELTVRKGKVLTLPAGIYYLTKLTIEDGARLYISGGTIFLAGNAAICKSSKLTAAIRCLPTAGNKIDVWGNATLAGTILAPDWEVVVHEGAALSGGIVCGKFSVSNSDDVPGKPKWKIN